jgi:thiamine biosynthesis lipoprotein
LEQRRRARFAVAFLLCLSVGRAQPALHLFEAVEPHMGTLVNIKLYARDADRAKAAFRATFDRISQLDGILSDYKPDSELNRIALSAVAKPAKVSDELFRVLEVSQELSEASGGAFDVTVGPVVRLWRQARKEHQLPDRDALDAALSHCGYRKLHLNRPDHTVQLDQDGMQLDLGGIAKGYAADEALIALGKLGIESALVAASGDIACSNAPPGRKGWSIEIEAKNGVAELSNAAVSTSGDSEQYLEASGKRYSHIVDPITGIALTSRIMVSIIAPRGILADGLATTVSVLGEIRGKQLAKKYPGVSIFVRSTASAGLSGY